jgi:hypothetical protein
MNYYRCSNGDKIAKSVVDYRIRQAKQKKKDQFLDDHNYIYCEDCGRSSGVRIDTSHDISVDECQKTGRTELAWSVENLTYRCNFCHTKHD